MYYNLLQLTFDKNTKTYELSFIEHHLQGPLLLSDPMLPLGLYNFAYLYYENAESKESAIKNLLNRYTQFITGMISDLEDCLNEYKDALPEFRQFTKSYLERGMLID